MLNSVLLKNTLRSNYKLLLIFLGVLAMYMTIIIGMFDPNDLDILNQLAALKLSPELLAAFGFTLTDTSLVGFISSYFYGLLMLALPMVCYIILGNSLVAKLVDRGSMASVLSTPISRKKVAFTQGMFLLAAITSLVAFVTVWGIFICEMKFSGLLDISAFIKVNFGVLLLHYAISGICFFASCLFNESKLSLMLGAGLPIGFLLIQMLHNANGDIKILKYLTIFSLFSPLDIIHGENILIQMLVLIIITVTLYIGGIIVFDKKNLPI
ncbi:hypothetical protein [Tissierella sp.]|uniref:hypothetical protein n=1 Tax=Tissierella sp. TaxID=41274 RepID=UPI00306ECFD6